jgi:aspartate/methionine/tyrosine aminotransferase
VERLGKRRPPAAGRRLVDTPALHDALLQQELGYPQTNGTVELRETIAAMYPGRRRTTSRSPTADPKPTASADALVEPGDEIVFLTPNYMQVRAWRAGSARPSGPGGCARDGEPRRWAADLDELKTLVTPKTRAISSAIPTTRPAPGSTTARSTRSAVSPPASAPG